MCFAEVAGVGFKKNHTNGVALTRSAKKNSAQPGLKRQPCLERLHARIPEESRCNFNSTVVNNAILMPTLLTPYYRARI